VLISESCICCGERADLDRNPAILMPFLASRIFGWEPIEIEASWNLATVPVGRGYSICNTVLCRKCDAVYLDMRFNDEELSRLYNNYRDDEYVAERERYEPGYRARNSNIISGISYRDKVEKFVLDFTELPIRRRILDYGGDTGINTPFRESSEVILYDISSSDKRLPLETADSDHTYFDLVVLANVIEHVGDPLALLTDVSRFMSKSTVLYIETPLEILMEEAEQNGRPPSIISKRHWHEHVNFFSKKSLLKLFERARLDVVAETRLNENAWGNWNYFQSFLLMKS